MKAIVIGSGVAGLSGAIRLKNLGFDVEVLEANPYPGGKLSSFELQGYRFDAGPSLFTLPELVDQLFWDCGKNPWQYFRYTKIKSVCHYFFEDGTFLPADQDAEKFAHQAQVILGEPVKNTIKYLNNSKFRYNITKHVFLENSLNTLSTYLHPKAFLALINLPFIGTLRKLHHHNQVSFKTQKAAQLFDRYATYNGSNPYKAPSTLSLIPHLEFGIGAFFPEGGMHSITVALYELALEMGVKFNFSTPARKIVHQNGRVTAVNTDQTQIQADLVLCNMDVNLAYPNLLADLQPPKRTLSQEKSSSALIFYWGIDRSFDNLDLHNIFFAKDYKAEFSDIFDNGVIHSDPTVYINISSKYCPSDAPSGCENWFVMVNAPSNKDQNWEEMIAKSRTAIIEKISRQLGVHLEKHIVCEAILDPRTIERRTSSHRGSLYGSSSNNMFSAFLRHANFSSKLKGLYFAGGSVHPGGGIPLCLSSSKIVEKLVSKDFRLKPKTLTQSQSVL
jgi:phytoene desaturase